MAQPFHLAFNVRDLDEARDFYTGVFGATEGRSTDTWVDFDFYGNQLRLHLGEPFPTQAPGQVGEHLVPMPHFGVVLGKAEWAGLADRLQAAGVAFVIPPSVRFEGAPGEQWTMFFRDPSGNPVEVKGFREMAGVFAG